MVAVSEVVAKEVVLVAKVAIVDLVVAGLRTAVRIAESAVMIAEVTVVMIAVSAESLHRESGQCPCSRAASVSANPSMTIGDATIQSVQMNTAVTCSCPVDKPAVNAILVGDMALSPRTRQARGAAMTSSFAWKTGFVSEAGCMKKGIPE